MSDSEFEITDIESDEYVVDGIDVDKEIVKKFHIYAGYYLEGIGPQPFPRKRFVFFNIHASCQTTTLRLCNIYKWCKHSKVGKEFKTIDGICAAGISTFFGGAVALAQAMTNSDKCSIFFTTVKKSLQINVKRSTGFTGACLIGVCVAFPRVCHGCGIPAVKLKMCSRCFKVDRVRVYYCSKQCQRMDYYERHQFACKYDWESDDWLSHPVVKLQ